MVNHLLLFVDYDTLTSEFARGIMSHKTWILLSGVIWGVIGCLLLYKGLQLLAEEVSSDSSRASWLIALGLLLGFFKGRYVFRKTVQRISLRIMSLPAPVGFVDAFPKSYWLLLTSMMTLGFLLRLVPIEVRGVIDVAIGSALMQGAMLYFRVAKMAKV